MSEGFGFEMAFCSECWSPLTRSGFCMNRCCPYTTYYQDEPVPGSEFKERRQVVGNSRSKLCYPWGSKGYKRSLKSPNAVVWRSVGEAVGAGYKMREE
jgi:hypothetical protein